MEGIVRAKRPLRLPLVLTREEVAGVLAHLQGVRDGKGRKGRVTMLPGKVRGPLAAHLERVRQQHQDDLRQGAGSVELPYALAQKYPHAAWEWAWQWVFPATRFYWDRETGQRRRHHLHESLLQRAVKEAVRRSGIPKPASCHSFREVYA